MAKQFGLVQIEKARQRIGPHIRQTPVLTSRTLEAFCPGKQLFFKCENFQKTGSFKSRGAMNALLCAVERNPKLSGVVTHSSGNHGQALAWAAHKNGLNCAVVVPKTTPSVKLEAIRAYGAQLVPCEPTMADRWANCGKIAAEMGYQIIDPHNDYDIMAGQGTLATELLEQIPDGLDAIIVSVGGGGLASGIGTYVKVVEPRIKVFCAEVEGKGLQKQLESGIRTLSNEMSKTMADGIRVIQIGEKCFGSLLENVEKRVFTLSEDEIRSATLLLWQRLKVVAEPSAALPLAAVLNKSNQNALDGCHKIGLILCGGNVHIKQRAIFGDSK